MSTSSYVIETMIDYHSSNEYTLATEYIKKVTELTSKTRKNIRAVYDEIYTGHTTTCINHTISISNKLNDTALMYEYLTHCLRKCGCKH